MVLAAPGPLLTPPPSSSPPKTPIRSYSAQTRSQNEEKNPPPKPYLPLQRRTPPILLELSPHYTGGRAQSACAERDASSHDITMFGMSGRRQTLSKSISDHQISAKRHEF